MKTLCTAIQIGSGKRSRFLLYSCLLTLLRISSHSLFSHFLAKQAQAEHDTLANRICKLEVDGATPDRELGVVARPVQVLRKCLAASKPHTNTMEGRASQTLNQMSELRSLVEVLNQTVSVERAKVAKLVEAKLL